MCRGERRCLCRVGSSSEPARYLSHDSTISAVGGTTTGSQGRATGAAVAGATDDSWLHPADVIAIPTDSELAAMPLSLALETLREAERRLLLGLGAVGETWQERLKCAAS